MKDGLPEEIWLGKVEHEWPVQAFTAAHQVQSWLAETAGNELKRKRRAWRVVIARAVEVELVKPEPYLKETNTDMPAS